MKFERTGDVGAPLRQAVTMYANLRHHGRCFGAHRKRRCHEQAAHPAEIDAGEKICEIDVQDPMFASMIGSIRYNAARGNKSMRTWMGCVDFRQRNRELILHVAY